MEKILCLPETATLKEIEILIRVLNLAHYPKNVYPTKSARLTFKTTMMA
jgi:hypothetical protein